MIWYSVIFEANLYLSIFVWSSDILIFVFMNVVILFVFNDFNDWIYQFRFKTIATLHSELLAVSTTGYLYQWCWTDLIPQRADNPTGNHPRWCIRIRVQLLYLDLSLILKFRNNTQTKLLFLASFCNVN